jgi:potassium efflux system protein
LADVVKAVPILVLTWASVRNLPGLIETVLLERLPLEKPVRYAITTLGTYALLFIGLSVSAQTFGLRWDNIQWLVAALGVGLGFGLQEIFANFVSGLILLFEQPIRVGDIVTLGDTTGVVARIRMRATTVTNWDRQELVIPNKDLITGRLVNWTLSDTTNRVVINVGVAYGSDTDQACELLKQICKEHPLIKIDPAPLVTFEGFGDSTLDLVVRCYLSDLDNRLGTIHELHTEINKRFNAAKIEIAFPQRDLNIRTLPPDFAKALSSVNPKSPTPSVAGK